VSGYGTLMDKPEFGVGGEIDKGEEADLSPLSGVKVRLSPELSKPGRTNKDDLSTLIRKAQSELGKEGWSAADYNNLACAYFWHDRENGKAKAKEYFNEALKHSGLSETERKTIKKNLAVLEAS